MFTLHRDEQLQKMAPVFESQGVSATYKRYVRTDRIDGENVDVFDPAAGFPIVALTGQRRKYSTNSTGQVQVETLPRTFIFRVTEIPTGIEMRDLTLNDKVVYLGKTCDIKDLRFADPFIHVTIEGS